MTSSTAQWHRACEEWRQWTLDEAAAIQAGNWPEVTRCQEAKTQIQQRLTSHFQSPEGRPASPLADGRWPAELRPLLAELIQLERDNRNTLANQVTQARARTADFRRSHSNLQRVRSAYGRRPQSPWQAFS